MGDIIVRRERAPREPKPYWRDVPQDVRRQVEAVIGASIRTGSRVFGGYGPSATFRIFFADGRTVFAKGAGKGSNDHNWRAVALEERYYREVPALTSFAPAFLGSVRTEGWHLLLLEDCGDGRKVPPWTTSLAVQAMRDVAELHARSLGRSDVERRQPAEPRWARLGEDGALREAFLSLFGLHRREAERWLEASLEALVASEAHLQRADQPWGLIHGDIRSDNIRFRDGRLVLFDWADLRVGPLIYDPVVFFPSVEAESGPPPEVLLPAYLSEMEARGIRFPDYAVPAASAAVSGIFALTAGQPEVPELPRLRQVQRMQLTPALRWAAAVMGLPGPPTLAS